MKYIDRFLRCDKKAARLISGCLLLFLTGLAYAAPTTSTSSSFAAANGQTRAYMDIGGVWDGTSDISATNGDVFTTSLNNTSLSLETALDLSLSITLPAGFVYKPGTASIALTGAGCVATPTLIETSTSSPLQFDFDPGQFDLPIDCQLTVTYELVAGVAASGGSNLVVSNWNYTNGGPDTENQIVQVRSGQAVLSFDQLSQTATVNSLIDFEITVNNSGTGALFDVTIDQTSINNNPSVGLQLIAALTELTPLDAGRPPVLSGSAPGDIITIPYLAVGESFTVRADVLVEDCVNLNNEARASHRVPPALDPVTAEVLLDLQVPLIDYTPASGNLNYSGTTTYTIPVSNTGNGPAESLVINTNLFGPGGPAVSFVSVNAGWSHDGNGNFTLTADLGAGPGVLPPPPSPNSSVDLIITVQPTDVCANPGGGTIEYTPSYTNACGTPYATPTKSGDILDPNNIPAMSVAKSATPGQLIIGSGDAASYTIDFTASDTAQVSSANFTVRDTLPPSLGAPLVVTPPPGTTISCPGGTCDPGEQVTWTIPNPAAGNVAESLSISFTAPTDACLGGTTLNNTAILDDATSTESCIVAGGNDNAGILLSNVPDPQSGFNPFSYSTAGGPFETGLPDDGNCTQVTGEGECIPYTASYRFPANYPGLWVDSGGTIPGNTVFTDNFGGLANQQLVPGTLTIDALEGGVSLTGGPVAVPGAAVISSTGSLVIDLGFLAGAGFYNDNNVADSTAERQFVIRYSATVPDSELGANVTQNVGSTAELLVKDGAGGSGACSNTLPDPDDVLFTIPTNYQLERAEAALALSITTSQTSVDVCEVLPVRLDISNTNSSNASDIFTQLLTTGTDYRFLNPPAATFGGQFSGPGVITENLAAPAGPSFEFTDQTLELIGGTIDVEVEVSPTATPGFGVGTPLSANLLYDDNETTLQSIGGAATPGRAFSGNDSFTPAEVRRGDLSIQTTPQAVTVTGSSVSWDIFVTNGGSGAAYNVTVENVIPAQLSVNVAATNAANGTCSGNAVTATAVGQTMSWLLPQVDAGTTCTITVVADVTAATGCSIPDGSSVIRGRWGCAGTNVQQDNGALTFDQDPLKDNSPNYIFAQPELLLRHDASSFCDLCDPSGVVTLLVRNVGGTRLEDVEITEDLGRPGSGLDLVMGSVQISINGGAFSAVNPAFNPQVVGNNYVWTKTEIAQLAELFTLSESMLGAAEIQIRFNVSSNESTLPGPQPISANATGIRPCDGSSFVIPPVTFQLPLRKPDILVNKTGDNNTTPNPPAAAAQDLVIAQPFEEVEWTVTVTNQGDHTARNARIRDILLGFPLRTGSAPGDVVINGPGIPVNTWLTPDYINAADLDDVLPSNTAVYTITERLGPNCFNTDNQADFTWGCTVNAAGAPSNLSSPTQNTDTYGLVMVPDFSSADAVVQTFTPLAGGRMEVTLTIRNDGAPARNLSIGSDLPAGFIYDDSFAPVIGGTGSLTLNSVDTTTAPNNIGNPLFVMNAGSLGFNETLVITFRVLQDSNFDTLSDPFINPEVPPGTDPTLPASGNNVVDINYSLSAACGGTATDQDDTDLFDALTPDIDIAVAPQFDVVTDGVQETYSFTLQNNGDAGSIADNITFSLPTVGGGWTIDAVEVVSSANGTNGLCSGAVPYTCSGAQIGTLSGAQTAVIEVRATPSNNGLPLTLIGESVGNQHKDDNTDTGNDYSLDQARPLAIGFAIIKDLLSTSEPYTTDNLGANTANVAIGEEATYNIKAEFFGLDGGGGEEIRNIRLRDSLDTSLGYVSHDSSASSGVTVSSVVGAPPAVLTPATAVISGQVDFNLNDITGAGGGRFDAQFVTRFLNNGRSNGDTLTNNFDAEFEAYFAPGVSQVFQSPGLGGSDAELHVDADLTAAVPTLTFDKQIRNITQASAFVQGTPTALGSEAGDVLEYRLTISNAAASGAPVFDLVVDDTLATSNLWLDTTPGNAGADTTGDNNINVSGGAITTGPPDQILFNQTNIPGLPLGQSFVQLDPGESITVLYRGTVQIAVNPAEPLDNNAQLTDAWTLPNSDVDPPLQDGNQTNGLEGDPDDTDGAANLTASDVANAIVQNSTAIAKVASGSILGNGADTDPDYRVGDIVTYTVTVTLAPQSTINNFRISDTLPAGLVFTSTVPTITTSGVTASGTPSNPTPGAGSHTWDFGTLTVNAPTNSIEIAYTAQVRDVPALPVGDQQDLQNNATVSFDTAGGPFSQSVAADIDVPQPNLTVTKTSLPAAPTTVDRGDLITYTVQLTNTGSAPAYDVLVRDVIPDGARVATNTFGILTATATIKLGAATVHGPINKNAFFPGVFLTDGEAWWNFDDGSVFDTIEPGETLELVYSINVDDDIGANVQLTNGARANSWYSLNNNALPPGVNVADRRLYGPSLTDTTTLFTTAPGNLSKTNPASTRVTIGEEFKYNIELPADGNTVDLTLYDVEVTDTFPSELTLFGITDLSPSTWTLVDTDPGANLLIEDTANSGVDIPPNQQIEIELDVRLNNTLTENISGTFSNSASYAFSRTEGGIVDQSGGPAVSTPAITIVEPEITPTKEARNVTAGDVFGGALTPPDAGDTVEFRIALTAAGGADNSDAFDLEIVDTLPAGVTYLGGTTALGAGSSTAGVAVDNQVNEPAVAGQVLTWSYVPPIPGFDIDVPAGDTVYLIYRVQVQAGVQPLQSLQNSAFITWTSLEGDSTFERDGSDYPAGPNDYGVIVSANISVADSTQANKVEASVAPLGNGTPDDGDGNYRIGDIVTYRIDVTDVTEASLNNMALQDILPEGLAYIAGSSSITQGAGITPDLSVIAPTTSGSGAPGDAQTISWNFGNVVNAGEAPNSTTPDTITISYQARVLTTAVAANDATNNATLSYDTATGIANHNDSVTVDIVLPSLTAAKTTTAGPNVVASEVVPYTVTLTNSGLAPAYDTVVRDTIPDGMRAAANTAGSISATVTIRDASSTITYGPAAVTGIFTGTFLTDGIVEWNVDLGNTAADAIPAGGTMVLQYNVQVDSDVGPGLTLINSALAQVYYSLDDDDLPPNTVIGDRGVFGPTAPDSVTLNTPTPSVMAKTSATTSSTPGDTVVYTLTIPDTPFGAQLYDVVVQDQLPPHVEFVSAAFGAGNGVTDTLSASVSGGNLLTLSSNPDGFDIPANTQAVIEVTVRHRDAGGGVAGDTYANSASYTWENSENGTDNFSGGAAASHTINVVEPTLIARKTGPATIDVTGGSFTIEIENIGGATAWDATIIDQLPVEMDDNPPVLTSVQIFDSGGTPRTLVQGADYTYSYAAGVMTFTMVSNNAAIGPVITPAAGEILRIVYTAFLDNVLSNTSNLTNVAGATQWFSQDSAAANPQTRTYNRVLTDGTVGTIDHEDAHVINATVDPDVTVEKTDTDLTGDPNVLAVGDTLRYTITVRNTGSGNSSNTFLKDLIPAHTTYVPGSTTLNGITVADDNVPANPTSQLERTQGMLINDNASATPGLVSASSGGIATVTFDVTVNQVVLGTILSNQATVTGERIASGTYPGVVSDDPATPAPNDPTQSLVGAGVILDAHKTVVSDTTPVTAGSSILTYTITVSNNGNIPANGALLIDDIPVNTTYVPNSTELNGNPVADPSPGVSQLETASGGLTINSAAAAGGQIVAGATAQVTFQVQVNAGTPDGTVISNQGTLSSNEASDELTDADGNDENGDQPTDIVVGNVASLDISKEVAVVGGGTAQAGGQLEYIIQVSNTGTATATAVTVSDPTPANTSYVAGSGTINGSTTGVNAAGTSYTIGDLAAGESALIRFRVNINAGLPNGTNISNTATASASNIPGSISDTANIDVGGAPGVVNLDGIVFIDNNHNDSFESATESPQAGWDVEIYYNASLVDRVVSAADGTYVINGLAPITGSDNYELRFVFPSSQILHGDSAPNTSDARYGAPAPQAITNINNLTAGESVPDENMPLDITGVVYDSVARVPVAGATITVRNSSNVVLATNCFTQPAQQNQVTVSNGLYLFELTFADASCPDGDDYVIEVTPPATGYLAPPSIIIPPEATVLNVTTCPNTAADADTSTPTTCEVLASDTAPGQSIPPGPGTRYYLDLTLADTAPGTDTDQVYNNHIPLDPDLGDAVNVSKTTPLKNVNRGQLVPYTITAVNTFTNDLINAQIIDTMPPGFKYVEGSASVNGVKTEPVINGNDLTWGGLTLQTGTPTVVKLILVIGSGVKEGEYINTATVHDTVLNVDAGEGTATVRIVPDPTFDCTDIIGKVFDDKNANGRQDKGEPGIPGARVATAQGLLVTADEYGRYHITCAAVPDEDRGSNFIVKLDERSLPSGYRMTTENPRVQRVTRGKMVKFNFGATIYRVVRIDVSDAAFIPAKSGLRPEWEGSLDSVIEQLREKPAILRIAYLGDAESSGLAKRRMKHIQEVIEQKWKALNCCYDLSIETELFWRRGRSGR